MRIRVGRSSKPLETGKKAMRIVSRILAGSRIAVIACGEERFCGFGSKRSQVKSSQVKQRPKQKERRSVRPGDWLCACAAGLIPASSFERDAASTGLEHLGARRSATDGPTKL